MHCVAPERVEAVRNRVLIAWPVFRQLMCKNISLCYSRAFYLEQFDSSSHPAAKFRNDNF